MNAVDRHGDLIEYLLFNGAEFHIGSFSERQYGGMRLGRAQRMANEQVVHVEPRIFRVVRDRRYVLVVTPASDCPRDTLICATSGQIQLVDGDEVKAVTNGIPPETLPPFGWPYLPGIDGVLLARGIAQVPVVEFNASAPGEVIWMSTSAYLRTVGDFNWLDQE